MGVTGEFPEEGPYYDVISPTAQDMHLRPDLYPEDQWGHSINYQRGLSTDQKGDSWMGGLSFALTKEISLYASNSKTFKFNSGRVGGLRLQTPAGSGTRPTSDRVREALFSRLEHLDVLDGAAVLDLAEPALEVAPLARIPGRVGRAEHARDIGNIAIGRLGAQHQIQRLRACIIPGDAGFRFHEHRINRAHVTGDGLRQQAGLGGQRRCDLLPIGGHFGHVGIGVRRGIAEILARQRVFHISGFGRENAAHADGMAGIHRIDLEVRIAELQGAAGGAIGGGGSR